jgi:hypothetical protein
VILIVDAGPLLNFLATNRQGLLLEIASRKKLTLAVPERVNKEVLGKSLSARFQGSGAHGRWNNLSRSSRIEILSDDLKDPQFAETVTHISAAPAQDRMREKSDLGELLVIAHGSNRAQNGEAAFIIIDEREGRRKAKCESSRVARNGGQATLTLWSTPHVLKGAADAGLLTDRWQSVYERMRKYDDGLPALSGGNTPNW